MQTPYNTITEVLDDIGQAKTIEELKATLGRAFDLPVTEINAQQKSVYQRLIAGDFDDLGYETFFAYVVMAHNAEDVEVERLVEPVMRYLSLHKANEQQPN